MASIEIRKKSKMEFVSLSMASKKDVQSSDLEIKFIKHHITTSWNDIPMHIQLSMN